ncbi:histidine kinase [Paenibacillus sp. EZ-K15]|uniref:histidine kinase n=1 Tax=Paenibacillus sp. EZ-K15 TaxID=2044275 RepID=UPI001F0198A1|nr:histidine kinase [Paenibacillus sp. EZ-K15]
MPWRLGSSAIFFTAFFLSPLYRARPAMLFVTLLVASLFSVISLWPTSTSALNPYILLVYSILAGKAVYRLPFIHAACIGLVLAAGAMMPGLFGYAEFPWFFLVLYSVILAMGLALFRTVWSRNEESMVRYETLLSEYRNMKRRLITDEQHARQEERAQVGRDIHDSVGHKLTALLMQLEMHRMQADGDTAEVLKGLKALAKESLEETRNAVKSMKQQEASGLPAIIGLLRRLESESFMRVTLTARHGALTVPLNNNQSIAVYRAVQEAMTNAMKHGSSREVHIIFEAPGGGIFRFEVSNPYHRKRDTYREGYGLKAMRERMEEAGGELQISQYDNQFIVRGTLFMSKLTEEGVR